MFVNRDMFHRINYIGLQFAACFILKVRSIILHSSHSKLYKKWIFMIKSLQRNELKCVYRMQKNHCSYKFHILNNKQSRVENFPKIWSFDHVNMEILFEGFNKKSLHE